MEKHNRRRTAFDLGGKYNAVIVSLVKSGYGKWQPTNVIRPSVEWFALVRPFYRFDLCAWGMCLYALDLKIGIDYWGGQKFKDSHWNYICKLRRLRKPWEAIKIGI